MRRTWKIVLAGAMAAMSAAFVAPAATAAPAAVQSLETSFFSGTVNPGATQTRSWNNANPLSVSYVVGLSPKGATTTQPCKFEVTRQWYRQNFGGEREFWYQIKNVGAIACGTDINLYSVPDITGSWNTGGVNVGQSVTKHWNNANPLGNVYAAGVSPEGATSTTPCQFEVTREWYAQQPGGEREFWFTLTNVGTIACSAEILLGTRASFDSSFFGAVASGDSQHRSWNNANPLSSAHIVGFSPTGATSVACQFEKTRQWYEQRLNSGVAERELHYTLANVGSIACSVDRKLAFA
ncbi:MAG: hypothetical protein ABW224_01505 [Kibdelosporangium sp.]